MASSPIPSPLNSPRSFPSPSVGGSQSVGGSSPPVVVYPVPDSGSVADSNPSAFVAPVSGVGSASQLEASSVSQAKSLPASSVVQEQLLAVGLLPDDSQIVMSTPGFASSSHGQVPHLNLAGLGAQAGPSSSEDSPRSSSMGAGFAAFSGGDYAGACEAFQSAIDATHQYRRPVSLDVPPRSLYVLGDGDMSFSSSLLDKPKGMKATTFESVAVQKGYPKTQAHLDMLAHAGVEVTNGVDAMRLDKTSSPRPVGRLRFNFPHTGLNCQLAKGEVLEKSEASQKMHASVLSNQALFHGLFNSAHSKVMPGGRVEVVLKVGQPYDKWNLVKIARENGWSLAQDSTPHKLTDEAPAYEHVQTDLSTKGFRPGNAFLFVFQRQE